MTHFFLRLLSTEAPNKNKLFVGNLPFKATADDLKELFSQFGELTDVFIPVDSVGEPRGFGFVTCAEGSMQSILDNCNGIELLGRRLTVNPPLAPGEKEEKKRRTGPRTSHIASERICYRRMSYLSMCTYHVFYYCLPIIPSSRIKEKALHWKSFILYYRRYSCGCLFGIWKST